MLAWACTRGSAHSTEWTWFSWSGIALRNCDFSGWTGDCPMSTGGQEPWVGLSCLSRNIIQHFNRQSHIKGPKDNTVVVCGVFDLSFKKCRIYGLRGKVAATRLFKLTLCQEGDNVCLGVLLAARGRKHCCRSRCLRTVIMWCDLKKKTLICLFPRCMVGQNLDHNMYNNIYVIM